jgi:hypothetical protein
LSQMASKTTTTRRRNRKPSIETWSAGSLASMFTVVRSLSNFYYY